MIDSVDQKLIQELQENGRRSNVELAEKLGLAESTVRKRIKDLVSKNIIKIAAMPNPYKLGYGFLSIMGLQVRMDDLETVALTLAKEPNIAYLAFVTGRYDMLALVICRTPEQLSDFIKDHISAISSIVRTETFVNLEVIKSLWFDPLDVGKLLAVPDNEERL